MESERNGVQGADLEATRRSGQAGAANDGGGPSPLAGRAGSDRGRPAGVWGIFRGAGIIVGAQRIGRSDADHFAVAGTVPENGSRFWCDGPELFLIPLGLEMPARDSERVLEIDAVCPTPVEEVGEQVDDVGVFVIGVESEDVAEPFGS